MIELRSTQPYQEGTGGHTDEQVDIASLIQWCQELPVSKQRNGAATLGLLAQQAAGRVRICQHLQAHRLYNTSHLRGWGEGVAHSLRLDCLLS